MKISIVTTAYNVDKYIKQTIESVLNLTYKDIEMIVVLDKPTDNTKLIVDIFKNKIKIINNRKNLGAGMSRRIGIEAATGDYVMLLDGDDWLDPDYIERLVQIAEQCNADIVGGGFTTHADADEETGKYIVHGFSKLIIAEGDDKFILWNKEDLMFMNNKIIRKSLLDMYPYCSRRYIEDTPTYYKVLWSANKVVYVPLCNGYHYRIRTTSLGRTATDSKNLLYISLCWFELLEFFIKNDPHILTIGKIDERVSNMINAFNTVQFTKEDIENYKDDFVEYVYRLNHLFVLREVALKPNMVLQPRLSQSAVSSINLKLIDNLLS